MVGHYNLFSTIDIAQHRGGLVVSASDVVGHRFASRSGHTKDHHENGTNCLPAWYAGIRVGV